MRLQKKHILTFHSLQILHQVTPFQQHAFGRNSAHVENRRFKRNLSLHTASPDNAQIHTSASYNARIAIIGGGASGMFAAAAAADYLKKCNTRVEVVVFEGTGRTMSKVRISGGGRCNVMHDKTLPLPQILTSYPRGSRELRGLYTKRFTPQDAYEWFTSRGVVLKTEEDGRMFPSTDDSTTIINVIGDAAKNAGVCLRVREKVDGIEVVDDRFAVEISSKSQNERIATKEHFTSIILATGSFPAGYEIARSLGHEIVAPVPSLFTLDSPMVKEVGGVLHGLAGVSVQVARVMLKVTSDMDGSNGEESVKKKKGGKKAKSIVQEGPLLITHHGISGPATLRLSAFAAREFNAIKYKCSVNIHFLPKWEEEKRTKGVKGSSDAILMDELWRMTSMIPKRKIATGCPLFLENDDSNSNAPIIPKRLWQALVQYASISPDLTWGDASKSIIQSLSSALTSFSLPVAGKGTFKEEFVTAGGVHLKEVQMTNMESKVVPGLFFCGEVLDVDGVTGGFNFMNCWSTGFVAGEGAAEYCLERCGVVYGEVSLN